MIFSPVLGSVNAVDARTIGIFSRRWYFGIRGYIAMIPSILIQLKVGSGYTGISMCIELAACDHTRVTSHRLQRVNCPVSVR